MAKEAKITELKSLQNEFEKAMGMYSDKLDDNDIRKMFERECERFKAALPIYAAKSKIVDTTANNQVFIVLGELGCGKSTQLVQYVYEATIMGTSKLSRRGQIVCTQPAKVAAITLARHVAQQIGCHVGDTVGYRVDKKGKENTNTAIKYVTDHVLLEECLTDATMSKYSCIVVDEAHQRTLCTDFLLGLLKQAVSQRPDLRLIILSDASHGVHVQVFQKYFNNCPVVEIRKPAEICRILYQERHINEQPNRWVCYIGS
jgi:HrpA-like RNA helicase